MDSGLKNYGDAMKKIKAPSDPAEGVMKNIHKHACTAVGAPCFSSKDANKIRVDR